MGRYTRLILVTKTRQFDPTLGRYYAQEHFQMEMGKCYEAVFNDLFVTPTDCYLISTYGDDNIFVTEDRYGEPLKELPVADALILLKALDDPETNSWRYGAFYDALISFMKRYSEFTDTINLYVLRYDW